MLTYWRVVADDCASDIMEGVEGLANIDLTSLQELLILRRCDIYSGFVGFALDVPSPDAAIDHQVNRPRTRVSD